ncbi:MAG TPA: hypothetical protein VFB58_15260, partial [Chloroflexota bacterium]|nr:hypothetical protein [Chloroflexota bacterium]HZU14197.1 hypothetical protein [Chloroflexota bacterium]
AVQGEVFIEVQSAPASAPIDVKFAIALKGKVLGGNEEQGTLDAQTPDGVYPVVFKYTPKKSGKYILAAQVTIGNAQPQDAGASLTVKKKKKH